MKDKPYGAKIITDREIALNAPTSEIYDLLKHSGVIVLRECFDNIVEFGEFVRKHSSRLTLDPGRTITGGVAQLVDAGTDAVGLHCENGNAPIWPDLTWFFCTQAPCYGSQTTLCDGVQVLDYLSDTTVKLFEEKRIRYTRTVPGEKWRRIVCYYDDKIQDMKNVRFEDLERIIGNDESTHMDYFPDDDRVEYNFKTSAIQRSTFSQKTAFANSILGPSFNYEKPVIDFEDGEPLAKSLLSEIRSVTDKCTNIVGWQDLDLVMIDNRRVMHGREKIVDDRRQIYNALSYR